MALGPRLDLRQSQSLVMTPQMQQAIQLLTLSNLEITSFLAEQLDSNPLLEVDDGRERGEGDSGADDRRDGDDPVAATQRDGDDATPSGADELINAHHGESDAPLDMDSQSDVYDDDCVSDRAEAAPSSVLDGSLGVDGDWGASGAGAGSDADWDALLSAEKTLSDHLHEQAGATLSGQKLFIARYLIDQIEPDGYWRGDVLDVARALGVAPGLVEQTLAAVQGFDPVGVGARSLAECIALQAREADRYDPMMARLLDNLDVLARGDLARLKRICRVDDEDLADMIAELRSYDPKPGHQFSTGPIEAVVPDLFVAKTGTGWAVELNSATLPRVLINRRYYAEFGGGESARNAADKKAKAWLDECLSDANWLVRALDQRQRTIMKVAGELVRHQEAFFEKGAAHLRPLTLRVVADAIDMHESTVSRVTTRKYLSCDRGLFELKYFFSSAIQASDGGDAASAEAVKAHLKQLIDGEDPKKILSDDKLVDLLKAKGFDIARRTVAKYREALGLGSSVQRRREKKLQAKT